jgi:hypothetical protein
MTDTASAACPRAPHPASARGRRRWLGSAASLSAAVLGAPLLGALPRTAQAGGQLEEPLADSVRSVLSAAIANQAPPKPAFSTIEERLAHLRWLAAMSERLQRQKSELVTRVEFLQTLWYETRRAGIDISLMLGLIQVESAFRKYAISIVGARGYTQVMPFWTRVIGDGDAARLFHMQTNLRFGCVILRHYLDREGGQPLPRPRALQRQPRAGRVSERRVRGAAPLGVERRGGSDAARAGDAGRRLGTGLGTLVGAAADVRLDAPLAAPRRLQAGTPRAVLSSPDSYISVMMSEPPTNSPST